jgi:hypothetical protein
MLRIPHCLDNRLTDGGKVLSLTHQPRSSHQKHYFPVSGTHFCQRLTEPQVIVQLVGLGIFKEFIHLIGYRTCDFPACSIVPQPEIYKYKSKCDIMNFPNILSEET